MEKVPSTLGNFEANSNLLRNMVGTRRFELLTSTVSSENEAVTNRKQRARMATGTLLGALGNRYWTPIGPQIVIQSVDDLVVPSSDTII